ncbi:uncharacterized protein LOC135937856 [Cloeon dipterum]|uniref:uncharacterized protein LOC135937856 n=1 Tax=Cloeon dipterum TaxID=197152 RepID=UPI0032209B0B
MLRIIGNRIGLLLARSSAKAVVGTTAPAEHICACSPIVNKQYSNASSVSSRQPQAWKMPPPSLTDLLIPIYRTPVVPKNLPVSVPLVPISTPGTEKDEIQAARLIVIRRHKMKKHKRKKLRKRMKFEWAKLRFRRETKKEKEFQDGLIKKVDEAHEFDAENYVQEKLRKLKLSGKL